MYHVYQILNTKNGKIYIGQTNGIKRRWKEHLVIAYSKNKLQGPIHKAIKKYSKETFSFNIIQELYSFTEALAAEKYWIQYYKTNIIRYGNEFGYNLSDGGDGGGSGPKSETHKKKILAML